MLERPLTVNEVAAFMRVSTKTVRRAIAAGHLEASQVSQGRGRWRVRPEAIDAWMELRSTRHQALRPLTDASGAKPGDRAQPARIRRTRTRQSGRLTA